MKGPACAKVIHLSLQSALFHVQQIIKKYGLSANQTLGPYQCEQCNFWHIGHEWAEERVPRTKLRNIKSAKKKTLQRFWRDLRMQATAADEYA